MGHSPMPSSRAGGWDSGEGNIGAIISAGARRIQQHHLVQRASDPDGDAPRRIRFGHSEQIGAPVQDRWCGIPGANVCRRQRADIDHLHVVRQVERAQCIVDIDHHVRSIHTAIARQKHEVVHGPICGRLRLLVSARAHDGECRERPTELFC